MTCQDCVAVAIGSVDEVSSARRRQPEAGHLVTDHKANPEVDFEAGQLEDSQTDLCSAHYLLWL